jgi:formylglycine-generating enzyme required for sulfatase activity
MCTTPSLRLVSVPAGAWTIGVRDPGPAELPVRGVELGAFRVAPAPVTNAEYRSFLAATGHESPPFLDDATLGAPGLPVVGVSWRDACAFVDWMRRAAGEPVRLPSADEREVAARAGRSDGRWPWGDEAPESRPELAAIAALDRPHEPGAACANAWGLSCLTDNVHEWCRDAGPPSASRPGGPLRRVSCGGSWRHRVPFTSVAARSSLPPDSRYADYGFRVFADP